MPRSKAARTHVHRDAAELRRRLNRISGQVDGVARMIDDDRYCIDILTQMAAIRSALDAIGLKLLHEHAQGCLQEAVRSGKGADAIEELMQVVKRFAR
jgi:CsoR family transcriptional regulator, copper-sensing transcriptional repressor